MIKPSGEIKLSKRAIIALIMFVGLWPAFGTTIAITNSAKAEKRNSEQIAKLRETQLKLEQTQRSLCGVIVLIDETSKSSPPTTERARVFSEAYSKLRKEYGC